MEARHDRRHPRARDAVAGSEADGKRWTFDLRRSRAHFTTAPPFDADAVVFSFERVIDPRHPQYLRRGRGVLARPAQGRRQGDAIDRAHRRDRDRAAVRAAARRPRDVSDRLADGGRHAGATRSGSTRSAPARSRSRRGTAGEQVVVRRFDGYWGARPALDRVVFRVVVDARQRLVELESGSVDLATAILPDEQSFVELHPDLELHTTPGNDVSYLAFNTQHPPFDDVRVRRAISYAINKEPIVKLAYQGRAIAADGPLPPSQWGYHKPARRAIPYDPVAAKQAARRGDRRQRLRSESRLQAVRAVDAAPVPARSPSASRGSSRRHSRRSASRPSWCSCRTASTRRAVQAGQHDLCDVRLGRGYGDPDDFLYVLFHSKQSNTETGAQNVALFRNKEIDDLLVAAQEAGDDATRSALYATIQDKIAAEAPWVQLRAQRAGWTAGRIDRARRVVTDRPSCVFADPAPRGGAVNDDTPARPPHAGAGAGASPTSSSCPRCGRRSCGFVCARSSCVAMALATLVPVAIVAIIASASSCRASRPGCAMTPIGSSPSGST